MVKTFLESTIEIWSMNYISHPESRDTIDEDKIIVQCENSNREGFIIVEVVDKEVLNYGHFSI